MSNTRLILHIKGTQQETTELPKQVVRAAISQGQITHSQLIWSPLHNAWKQVRELPQLLPSQKLAPAPPIRQATGALPKVEEQPKVKAAPVPKVKVAVKGTPVAKAAPKVQATGSPVPVAVLAKPEASSDDHLVVKEADDGFHPMRWLCIGLGGAILLAVVFNYFMVYRPLAARLGQTSYGSVSVVGHLGAFIQPGVIVIHIASSDSVTRDTLPDFLVALAHSTPETPGGSTFDRVAITSGWVGQYSFSGFAWKQLGDMDKDDAAQRKEFILEQMGNASGQPLLSGNANLSEESQQAEREKVWNEFLAQFTKS